MTGFARIWFLRHGQSLANELGVFAGPTDDSPLSEAGLEQARSAAGELSMRGVAIREIIHSPSRRARQTAIEAQVILGIPDELMRSDNRIVEYDMGEHAGTPIRPMSSMEFTSGKGVEDPDSFRARVLSFMQEMLQKPEGDYLVVSHGGVGRCIESAKRGMPANSFYELPGYANAHPVLLDLEWLRRS